MRTKDTKLDSRINKGRQNQWTIEKYFFFSAKSNKICEHRQGLMVRQLQTRNQICNKKIDTNYIGTQSNASFAVDFVRKYPSNDANK
jgi:hypothetical protein